MLVSHERVYGERVARKMRCKRAPSRWWKRLKLVCGLSSLSLLLFVGCLRRRGNCVMVLSNTHARMRASRCFEFTKTDARACKSSRRQRRRLDEGVLFGHRSHSSMPICICTHTHTHTAVMCEWQHATRSVSIIGNCLINNSLGTRSSENSLGICFNCAMGLHIWWVFFVLWQRQQHD